MQKHIDTVVVGAGPVGLLTAIELTLGGAGVLMLERLAVPSPAMKAMGLGPLGIEALQRRGMAAALDAAEARNAAVMRRFAEQAGADPRGRSGKFSGHFAGLLIPQAGQTEPERRPRQLTQPDLEALLADRAHALGIEVRRGCEVTGFVEHAEGVDVEWTCPAGAEGIRCAYLVGCDGGRSTIRKLAGFDFPGTAPTSTFYQITATLDHPERLPPPGWTRTPQGVFSYGPVPGRLFMLDFSGPPPDRQVPVTREEIETVLRRISGRDVRVDSLESASRWGDNTRLADTYRRGRILLVGDAAHVHSPFGGQGLNLGLVDAANLGWKLAAVVRGGMPESLLDTYTAERRPVAEAVLANTLAQIALLRPDPQSGALRDLLSGLLQQEDVSRAIGDRMRGLTTRYDLGADHDQVGRLIGNRPIPQGDTEIPLYDLMQDGNGVLLDASPGQQASKVVIAYTDKIRCIPIHQGPSLLIRPDSCVAWVEEGIEGLEEGLFHWF